jgi:hypothetical protein
MPVLDKLAALEDMVKRLKVEGRRFTRHPEAGEPRAG